MNNLLSSDILEAQFGPTEIAVLHQDETSRIICTKVIDGGQILEISRVTFDPAGIKAYAEIHRQVVAGMSMGKAFRQAGVDFRRQVHRTSQSELPPALRRWFGSTKKATTVEVSITVGPQALPYARILEVYSPAVRWPDLRA